MKTRNILSALFCVFALVFITSIKAQVNVDDIIQTISYQLDNSDLEEIENAKKSIDEANQMIDELSAEDERLEKYFKKKEKKGEKKSVYAKQYRIDAMNLYYDGLSSIHSTLVNRLNFAIFEYPEDQANVDNLKSRASDLITQVRENLVSFQGLDKKDYVGLRYYDLITELESNMQMMLGAIDLIKDGFIIWANQVDKKQKEEEDNAAWSKATDINTIEAYNDYISNFANGKYVTNAKDKIKELEEMQARLADEEARKKAEADSLAELERQRKLEEEQARLAAQEVEEVEEKEITGLMYCVQIMAVYFKVNDEKLKTIYKGEEEITERFEDGMYKYSIGEFQTFNEAREFRKTLTIPSFIVAYQDGERIPTNDAKKMETTKNEEVLTE